MLRRPALAAFGTSLLVSLAAVAVYEEGDPCNPAVFCGSACGRVNDGTCNTWCGGCPGGYSCNGNYCQAQCTPVSSCAAQGMNCGSAWNGCAYESCGGCPPGYSCGGNNVCQPPPSVPDGEQLCDGSRAFAHDDAPSLFNMLCGVGVQNGSLALNWLGQWFTVGSLGLQGWSVANNAGGASWLGVAPVDAGNGYVADQSLGDDFDDRTEFRHGARTVAYNWRTRSYSVDVNGRHYDLTARQNLFDHQVYGGTGLQIRGDVTFTITTYEPADGSTWRITLTPELMVPGVSSSSLEAAAENAEASGQSNIGGPYTLFGSRSVIYSPTVDLASALRSGGQGATALAATASPAVNRAIDGLFANVSQVYSMYEPQAVNVGSTLLGTSGQDIVSFDQQRQAQFYMATRSSSGFSDPGLDRTLIDTQTDQWTFRKASVDYQAYWPFLGGICGLSAQAHSSVDGSFQVGATQCFDGLFTSASARGSLSFNLAAGGGFGCDVLLASGSAGLDASVSEIFEFGSDVATVPPKLTGYVRLYSSLGFNAYFQVRVLFWSKRWEKNVAKTTVFQRQSSWEVLPALANVDVCSLMADDAGADDAEPGVTDGFADGLFCDGQVWCGRPNGGAISHPSCDLLGNQPVCIAGVPSDPVTTNGFLRYPVPSTLSDPRSAGRVTLQNVDGACNGRFGAHRPNRDHPGLDLWAPRYTPIYPSRDGQIIAVKRYDPAPKSGGLGGLRVLVSGSYRDDANRAHDLLTNYMHMSSYTIFVGARERTHTFPIPVTINDVIGYAGMSGNACHNEHTHFELSIDNVKVDPTYLFSQRPAGGGPASGITSVP